MKQKNHQKKKRSRPGKGTPGEKNKKEKEEQGNINDNRQEKTGFELLIEAFVSVAREEIEAAYKESGGDPNGAAGILSDLVDNGEDPSTCSVSSDYSGLETGSSSGYEAGSSSGSSSLEGSMETGLQNFSKEKGYKGSKQKRAVAVTGTVSTVLGKGYVKPSLRKEGMPVRVKESGWRINGIVEKEEAEQFLCSMLGDGCELNMAVVRDVLCQCGNDVDKALGVLLDMSGSSFEESLNNIYYWNDDVTHLGRKFESKLQDIFWDTTDNNRTYSEVLTGSKDLSSTNPRYNEVDLPQKVLESLFNIPQSPKHEPSKMNWRNVVKKLQSLGPGFDATPANVPQFLPDSYAKGDEYHVFRERANHHWDARNSYYQRAAEAHSKGERGYAAYLSDQGREKTKVAHRMEERASQDIFKARNQGIENVITIDLHGQHVKQAMRLLKLHLVFGSHVPSVQALRVITGCGTHGAGKSKVKQSVRNLLEREGVEFHEENRGTLLIKMDGYREFGFVDTGSDSE